MTNPLPKTKDELLAEIEREWTLLIQVAGQLSFEQMARPDSGGWSPKDNLAHVAAWMHFLRECYLGTKTGPEAMGIDAAEYGRLDEDGQNAVLFERNRDRSLEDVIEELNRTYGAVVETLQKMPFSDLMKPLRPDDPEKRLVINGVLGNTSEHFLEHRQVIERAL